MKWLREQNILDAYDENIIEAVRAKFMQAWNTGTPLPKIKIPARRSPADLIELCRPKRPIPENAENLDWYAEWLTWWVLCVFPDDNVRDEALDKALPMQRKGWI